MGPREKKLDETYRFISSGRVGIAEIAIASMWERERLARARLADALEEALDGWDNLICRFRGQDEALARHTDRVTTLRALLAEVDRG